MTVTIFSLLRLVAAATLGAVIGIEREWRAKEAGLRTHFLVAMGSCLFMLVSQYGFDLASVSATPYVANGPESAIQVDVARVAASVVSGISFLGAGVIVLHRRFVLGLTTAATIWTTAAIGMAVGGGLYPLAVVATLLVLAGLEAGRLADRRIGRARREVRVVFSAPDDSSRTEVFRSLREVGAYVSSYSVEPHGTHVRIHLLLEATTAVSQPDFLIALLEKNPGVHTESVE